MRIAVADDEAAMRDYLEDILSRLGHEVVVVSSTGRELVDKSRTARPDLVITDIKMPQLDGIDAAIELYEELPVPVILISAHHESELIERCEAEHIMAYLVKPIKKEDIATAMGVATRRFKQFQEVVNETATLKQALEDRKLIERAKGVLMKEAQLSEEDAFRRMQKLARRKSQKLIQIAEIILAAKEAFEPGADGA